VEPGLFPRRELEKINPMTAPSRLLFTDDEYLTHEKVQRIPQPVAQEHGPQISISIQFQFQFQFQDFSPTPGVETRCRT